VQPQFFLQGIGFIFELADFLVNLLGSIVIVINNRFEKWGELVNTFIDDCHVFLHRRER